MEPTLILSVMRRVITPVCARQLPVLCLLLAILYLPAKLNAQQLTAAPDAATDSSSLDSSLPDSPSPQTTPPPDQDGKQTTRILEILPNFRAVNANEHLPPQTVKEKFVTATEDSFDYSSLFVPLALAGYNELRTNTPEFGGGGLGYARYLWHSAVDQTIENYMVEAIVPSLTREDNRYYTLGSGGFWHRTGYALSRAVVTRNDHGKDTFNISEVFGAGAAAGISNLYYPSRERTFGNTGKNWGIDVAIDAAAFVLKEFWPDIHHALFHGEKPFKDANPAH
jgi:hypothetical protein